jgi:cystathionine beta-lyase
MRESSWPEFDHLSFDDLRRRRSEKWTRYPSDVLPSAVAEMDFPLAPPVREVLHAAVELGDCGYASPDQRALAEAYAGFAHERFGWTVDPSGVTPVTDVMVGVAEILRRTTSPGAGVIINPPVYPPFFSTINEIGRQVVEAPLARSADRYELDLDAVEQGFEAGAEAYLLCNPHNPIGQVWDAAELQAVAELAERYDAVVIADEVHAPLVLPGAKHQPYVALGGPAARRGITITAASKGWNFAGLKCAVLVTETGPMRSVVEGFPTDLRDRVGHLGVLASRAAWRDGGSWLDDLLGVLDRNRRLVGELLESELPAVDYAPPAASYLAWLDCRDLGLGADPAKHFLERGRVALMSGLDFGREGAGFARLNLGTSAHLLTEAVRRLAAAVP